MADRPVTQGGSIIAIGVAEVQAEMEPTERVFPFSLSYGVGGIARERDTG
jgi:hypothetical protein